MLTTFPIREILPQNSQHFWHFDMLTIHSVPTILFFQNNRTQNAQVRIQCQTHKNRKEVSPELSEYL